MATESGVEGKMVRYQRDAGDGTSYCYPVSNWTLESNPHLAEDTNACTGGHAHRSMVKTDYKLTASIFVTAASGNEIADHQPETDVQYSATDMGPGMIEGEHVTLSLRVGGTLNAYNNWEFIIDTVTIKGCDANGLVSYEVVLHSQEPKPTLATFVTSYLD